MKLIDVLACGKGALCAVCLISIYFIGISLRGVRPLLASFGDLFQNSDQFLLFQTVPLIVIQSFRIV